MFISDKDVSLNYQLAQIHLIMFYDDIRMIEVYYIIEILIFYFEF